MTLTATKQTAKKVSNTCRHCGGVLFPDVDGDYACLMCGRPMVRRQWEQVEAESIRKDSR